MQRRTSCTRCALPFDRPGLEQCAGVASFLSALTPKVGQAWWLPDLEEHALGQNAAWYKGTIVETSEDEITVQLDDAQPRPGPASVAARSTVPIGHHGDFTELLEAGRRAFGACPSTRSPRTWPGMVTPQICTPRIPAIGGRSTGSSRTRGDNVATITMRCGSGVSKISTTAGLHCGWPRSACRGCAMWGVKLEMYCLCTSTHSLCSWDLVHPAAAMRVAVILRAGAACICGRASSSSHRCAMHR